MVLARSREMARSRAHRQAQTRQAARTAAPLAYVRLWHREAPRTSQRRAAEMALDPRVRIALVNGGNRAGKTDLGAQWALAHALGRNHPQVQAWARINGLDVRRIQPGPGVVWAVSLTFQDSRRYVREKLSKYLPAGTEFRQWNAENEAEALLPGGGKIVCKAWAQGREGMQGDAIHGLWADEEPPDQSAWNEALMRLGDFSGRALVTFTPLMGLTWMYDKYVKTPPKNVGNAYIHGTDNPHVPPEVLLELLSGFSEKEQAARQRGEWVQVEGRLYPFDRAIHVVAPFEIPAHWLRWVGIDWGARSPHVVWLAEDPQGNLYAYRELAPRRTTGEPGITDRQLVEWMLQSEAESMVRVVDEKGVETWEPETDACRNWYRVADSESPGALEEAAQQGLWLTPATKGPGSVLAGVRLVESFLQTAHPVTGTEQKPRLYLIEGACPVLLEELTGMRWAKQRPGHEPAPDPACADHGPDGVRYVIQFRQQLGMQ